MKSPISLCTILIISQILIHYNGYVLQSQVIIIIECYSS
jgi:hypothetical protein